MKAGISFGAFLCVMSAIPGGLLLLFTLIAFFGERSGTSEFWVPGTFALELQLLSVFPLFLLAGVIGGVLVGPLRPLLRWRVGAVVLGMLAGFVLYATVSLAVLPLFAFEPFSAAHLLPALLIGTSAGGYWGFKDWKPFEGRARGIA